MKKRFVSLLLCVLILSGVSAASAASFNENSAAARAYRAFISSRDYDDYVRPVSTRQEDVRQRDRTYDRFCLHDMDGDGMPELLVFAGDTIEQVEVFTYNRNGIRHLGTMCGTNFINYVRYYDDARYPGVFVFIGGIAQKIEQFYIQNGKLVRKEIGSERIGRDERVISIEMETPDARLENMLFATCSQKHDQSREVDWYLRNELYGDSVWRAFFASATGLK